MVRRAATLLGALAMIAAMPAHANGLSATANGEAQAEVVIPLVATREADLEFGTIFASATAGSVTVHASGQLTYFAGAQPACIQGACSSAHPARFTVVGERGRSYTISTPAAVSADGILASGGAAAPLEVDAITVRSDSRPSAGNTGTLDSTGHDAFQVGGTLIVPAGLPSASYRATLPVIVAYS